MSRASSSPTRTRVLLGLGILGLGSGSLLVVVAVLIWVVAALTEEPALFRGVGVLLGLAGFSAGLGGTICLRRRTKGFRSRDRIGAGLSLLGLGVGFGLFFLEVPANHHSIDDLRFVDRQPPTVRFTGLWHGRWADPEKGIAEELSMTLVQEGHRLEGYLVADGKTRFDISEGTVSGDELHLAYHRSRPAWDRQGASLRGKLRTRTVIGDWYVHGRAWTGHFEVRRIDWNHLHRASYRATLREIRRVETVVASWIYVFELESTAPAEVYLFSYHPWRVPEPGWSSLVPMADGDIGTRFLLTLDVAGVAPPTTEGFRGIEPFRHDEEIALEGSPVALRRIGADQDSGSSRSVVK